MICGARPPTLLVGILLMLVGLILLQFTTMFRPMFSNRAFDQFLGATPVGRIEEQQENGWKDIHVFYGDTKHLKGKNSKGQCGQEKLVAALLNQKQDGYFVDLAANDATSLSNTYKLETDLNWNGLCVEPNPRYWRQLSYRRCKIVAAVVGNNRMEQVNFKMHDGSQRAPSGGIESAEFDNTPEKPKTNDPGKEKIFMIIYRREYHISRRV